MLLHNRSMLYIFVLFFLLCSVPCFNEPGLPGRPRVRENCGGGGESIRGGARVTMSDVAVWIFFCPHLRFIFKDFEIFVELVGLLPTPTIPVSMLQYSTLAFCTLLR